jgi:hypothetical protein
VHAGDAAEVAILNPPLPMGIDRLSLHGLEAGDGDIDLALERQGSSVAVHSNRARPAPAGKLRRAHLEPKPNRPRSYVGRQDGRGRGMIADDCAESRP